MSINILEEIHSDGIPESYKNMLKDDYLFDIFKIVLLTPNLDHEYILSIDKTGDIKELEENIKNLAQEIEHNDKEKEEEIFI